MRRDDTDPWRAEGRSVHRGDATVRDLMTIDVVTLREDQDLALAAEIMSLGRFRHIPVVDATQRLVGLVSHRDVLRAYAEVFAEFTADERQFFGKERVLRQLPVGDVMVRDVLTVTRETSALQAARKLREHRYGCLPVVDHGVLEGIVTESDFVDLVIRALEDEEASDAIAALETDLP